MDKIRIIYNGEEIEVDKTVADYLNQERRREQAADKSDKRHLDMRELNDSLLGRLQDKPADLMEQLICENEAERLIKAINILSEDEQVIIINRYFKEEELVEIAENFGVTYQAIQKRLKTILKKLRKFLS